MYLTSSIPRVQNRELYVQKRQPAVRPPVPEWKLSPPNYGIRADPLSQFTDEFRIEALTMGITRAVPPWSLTVRVEHPRIVILVQGSMSVSIETAKEPLRLDAGDVLLLPPATMTTLRDSPDTPG